MSASIFSFWIPARRWVLFPVGLFIFHLSFTVTGADDRDGGRGETETPLIATAGRSPPKLIIDETRHSLYEGETIRFTVHLDQAPINGDVQVTIIQSEDNPLHLAITPPALTFDAANWWKQQVVTVTVPEDLTGNDLDREFAIRLFPQGGGVDETPEHVILFVRDHNILGVVMEPELVTHGGYLGDFLEQFNIRLNRPLPPDSTVILTVEPSEHNIIDFEISHEFLEFNSSNWNSHQTVSVSYSGRESPPIKATLHIDVFSRDNPHIRSKVFCIYFFGDDRPYVSSFTASPNPVDEGGSVKITASITKDLDHDVLIPLLYRDISADYGDYYGPEEVLIPGKGNVTSGTGIIKIPQEEDASDWYDETFRVEIHQAQLPSTLLPGQLHSVDVTIIDDDKPAVTLTASPDSILEGASSGITLTVTIAEDPLSDIVVPLTYTNITSESSDYTGPSHVTIPGTGSATTTTAVIMIPQETDRSDWYDETFAVAIAEHDLSPSVLAGNPKSALITILDDDEPTVILSVAPDSILEGNNSGVLVTVTISEDPAGDLIIPLNYTNGTTESDDYLGPLSITIPGTGTNTTGTGTIRVPQESDTGDWEDETFTVSIHEHGLPSEILAGDPKSAPVTIIDDDEPAVTLSASPNPVPEDQSVTITAILTIAPAGDLKIPLTYTNETAETGDYRQLALITIPANATTGTGAITTVTDTDADDETFIVALGTLPPNVVAGSPSSVQITIAEKPAVSLSASPNPVDEGNAVTLTATLSKELKNDITIPLTLTAGTAETDDYQPLPSIAIPKGARRSTGMITTAADADTEDETFTAALGTLPPEVIAGLPSSVQIIINDNSSTDPVTVHLDASPNPVDEGGTVTVTAILSETMAGDVTIALTNLPGTTETEDYIPIKHITIPGRTRIGSGHIYINEDDESEENEKFKIALHTDQLPSGIISGNPSEIEITIIDDGQPPAVKVTLSVNQDRVNEGDPVMLTIELSEKLPSDAMIPLLVINGSAGMEDYHAPPQLEMKAGIRSRTYLISTVQDVIMEGDETFTVKLGTLPPEVVAGNPSAVEVTIIDDEEAAINAPESVSVLEGGENTFAIWLASQPFGEVTVTINWPWETNQLDVTPVTQIFTPDNWNQRQEVTLAAAKDSDSKSNIVVLTLTSTGSAYSDSKTVSVTIIDHDVPSIAAPAFVNVTEGSSESFTIRLTAPSSSPVTVSITGDTGTYLEFNPASLTFTPDNWNASQKIILNAIKDDNFWDAQETLILTADGGDYAGLTHPIEVTIRDTDEAGIKAPEDITIQEGATTTFMVSLAAEPSAPVTVNLTGHTGTQLILSTSSLSFTSVNWQTEQPVTLTANEDNSIFENHFIDLVLTATGGGYNESHTANVTILDLGPLIISIRDAEGSENTQSMQLPILLSRPADDIVTVEYETKDRSALAGDDYTASRGIVIFDPGSTRGVVEIEIASDGIPEGAEEFEVTLSNPRNADIMDGSGIGTILDNLKSANIWIDDVIILKEEEVVRFRVSLSDPQDELVTAMYQTQDGTARAGEDYEANSGVVTLAPGTTEAIITVALLNGGLDWNEETFSVHLVSSRHAEIKKAVGVATIQKERTAGEGVMEAYAARFVRTASMQVVDALSDRFRFAADQAVCAVAERAEMAQFWYPSSSWDPSPGELLAGCRMSRSMPVSSGSFSVWGQGAFRQFNGQAEDDLTISGEVTTGMLGADYLWNKAWRAGALLAHSQGDGSFEISDESGEISSALTGFYPYMSYTHMAWDVWLSVGLGHGNAEMSELKGNLTSRFGVMGLRAALASGNATRLSYHGDILVTDTEINDHNISSEMYRIRAGLEVTTRITDRIRPYVEANVRQDGGSAETGTGLELGGGVRFAHPAVRIRGEMHTQGLIMHTADGFSEWGISGALQIGNRSEGWSVRVRPSWGRASGMSMYHQQTMLDAIPFRTAVQRTELELGYGIPWGDGTARSIMGMTRLPQGMMYRLGGELHRWERLSFSAFGLAHGRATTLGDLGLNIRGTLQY